MYMGLGFCKVKKMEEKHSKNGVTEIWNTSGNDERWDTCQLPGVHPLVCITKNLLQIQRIAPQTSTNWSVGSHYTSEMAGYSPHQWKAISPLINPYHLSECPNSFIFPSLKCIWVKNIIFLVIKPRITWHLRKVPV